MALPSRRLPEAGLSAGGRRPRPSPEPSRGLPLGLGLGLILAVVVSAVLALTTLPEQRRELALERRDRERLLSDAITPIAADMGSLETVDAIQHRLVELVRSGPLSAPHGFLVRDATGHTVASAVAAGPDDASPPADALVATTALDSPALAGGEGTLLAWRDAADLRAELGRRWRSWWLDLLITSLAVILAVELAVHLLVGRPLGRLVRGLDRLGNGHVGPLETGPGAWEIRWLAWRFERLGRDLEDAARHLLAAERRALEAVRSVDQVHGPRERETARIERLEARRTQRSVNDHSVRRYLDATAGLLERLRQDDPSARSIAEEAWTQAVAEAERIGDATLKARLEDAALRVLEPVEFAELDARLSGLRAGRDRWVRATVERLAELLHAEGIGIREVQHRTKHTAGAWRKMREHQLELEQVHDLFAFRLIVDDEAACYRALGAVHRAFEPEPFRFKDYIAQPKPNGYRSLHTSVRDTDGRLFEVQIRTPEMHHAAEEGAAAHWRYRARRWARLDRLRPARRRWWRRER